MGQGTGDGEQGTDGVSPPTGEAGPARPSSLAPRPSSGVPAREAGLALTAGFLGWTLDAFDYFLVVISLRTIAADFQVGESAIALSLWLTLAFRPLGALVFGLLADRYGRRIPLMADLVFYSAVEVATAFAPNLATFLVLRALFGIGMGGEWGVGTSLVMEKVSARWRGVLSGLLQEGYCFVTAKKWDWSQGDFVGNCVEHGGVPCRRSTLCACRNRNATRCGRLSRGSKAAARRYDVPRSC